MNLYEPSLLYISNIWYALVLFFLEVIWIKVIICFELEYLQNERVKKGYHGRNRYA